MASKRSSRAERAHARRTRWIVRDLAPLVAAWAVTAVPAASQERRALTPSDYARWERLGSFSLAPDGRWLAASVSRVDEWTELQLRSADGVGEPLVLEHGSSPVFSADGRWLAYRKGHPPEEPRDDDEDEEGGEPPPDSLGLVDLGAGVDTVLFAVESFAFRDDGVWLAALVPAASDTVGGDLVVLRPGTKERTLIGNVDAYAWQDDGPLLAATLRTAGGVGNGVVLLDPDAGTLRTLASADAHFRALAWRRESAQLGVLRSSASEEHDDDTHDVLVWQDVTGRGEPRVLEARGHALLADTLRIAESGGIAFGQGGNVVFLGVRPWTRVDPAEDAEASEPGADRAEDEGGRTGPGPSGGGGERSEGEADAGRPEEVGPADVQVWHWNDDLILRAQEYSATQIAARTLLAAWHVEDDGLVVLGRELDEPVRVVAEGRWGLAPDYDPYHVERRFGDDSADWYRVDVRTGAHTLLVEDAPFGVDTHPDADRVLVYQDDRWWALDLTTLDRTALAGGRSFTRSAFDYDYPGPRPDWGVGGWIDGGEALIYDEHDVWRVDLRGGEAARITAGAEEDRTYRVVRPDPEARASGRMIGAEEPLWLSVFENRTKASGYARVTPSGAVEPRVLRDARVTGLTRAADAEAYALRVERWDDAPDVFAGGEALDDLVQVTELNPFQNEYAWGRSELLDYTTDAGHDLQGVLVYPAGFEEGRRYPLILYQYERLSDGLHAYDVPSERDYYNYQVWSQQGYFVLMPDIVYEPGRPGPSALDAVEHALDAAVATGHVDSERMGVIGHSWGGYQASYLPTRTDRFAAAVAGAPITNFLSFMGAVHWNGGLPETGHWETGQARMAVPYWEDLEGHLESSPAHGIANLTTPVLLMHGDADGVVDFRQGLEFYNYARRAGKEVVLLVYPGADHGLRDEEHQVDYHRRILEWFGHYLKGEPAPRWITDGESWVEREKRIGKE